MTELRNVEADGWEYASKLLQEYLADEAASNHADARVFVRCGGVDHSLDGLIGLECPEIDFASVLLNVVDAVFMCYAMDRDTQVSPLDMFASTWLHHYAQRV